MSTWADEDGLDEAIDRDQPVSGADDDEEVWDTIKPISIRDVDERGNRVEITKKVRTFHLERDARPSDLRKKLAVFGKAKTQDKDSIVSKEPPLALELGSADKYERESRAEIKRFMAENVEEVRGAAREDAGKELEAATGTWGTNRTTTVKSSTSTDVKRRVRVCNVSDDITEENLINIFSANGADVERVYLATDSSTGNNKGYAFVTFRDEKYVLDAVRQRRFHFKNVVLSVSHAMDRRHRSRTPHTNGEGEPHTAQVPGPSSHFHACFSVPVSRTIMDQPSIRFIIENKEDYYKILGVGRQADAAAIRRAYHRRALLLHPDKSPGEEAGEACRAINGAYEVLMDPLERMRYDLGLSDTAESSLVSGMNMIRLAMVLVFIPKWHRRAGLSDATPMTVLVGRRSVAAAAVLATLCAILLLLGEARPAPVSLHVYWSCLAEMVVAPPGDRTGKEGFWACQAARASGQMEAPYLATVEGVTSAEAALDAFHTRIISQCRHEMLQRWASEQRYAPTATLRTVTPLPPYHSPAVLPAHAKRKYPAKSWQPSFKGDDYSISSPDLLYSISPECEAFQFARKEDAVAAMQYLYVSPNIPPLRSDGHRPDPLNSVGADVARRRVPAGVRRLRRGPKPPDRDRRLVALTPHTAVEHRCIRFPNEPAQQCAPLLTHTEAHSWRLPSSRRRPLFPSEAPSTPLPEKSDARRTSSSWAAMEDVSHSLPCHCRDAPVFTKVNPRWVGESATRRPSVVRTRAPPALSAHSSPSDSTLSLSTPRDGQAHANPHRCLPGIATKSQLGLADTAPKTAPKTAEGSPLFVPPSATPGPSMTPVGPEEPRYQLASFPPTEQIALLRSASHSTVPHIAALPPSPLLLAIVNSVACSRDADSPDIPPEVIIAFDEYIAEGSAMLLFPPRGRPAKEFFAVKFINLYEVNDELLPEVVFGWKESRSSTRMESYFLLSNLIEVSAKAKDHPYLKRFRGPTPGHLQYSPLLRPKKVLKDDCILRLTFCAQSEEEMEEDVVIKAPNLVLYYSIHRALDVPRLPLVPPLAANEKVDLVGHVNCAAAILPDNGRKVSGPYTLSPPPSPPPLSLFISRAKDRLSAIAALAGSLLNGSFRTAQTFNMNAITNQLRRRLDGFKAIVSIPPFSESMAGVIILFVFTNSVATSIWMFNAWSPFIFTLFHGSNLYVGLMAAAHGICELLFAFLSGHIADTRIGHSRMLLFAVRFGLVTLSTVLLAIWTESFFLLILAQCFEGIYMGLSFTCLESVFAQCLNRGERDRLYSVKFSCEAGGPIIGLVLSAVMYTVIGNQWQVSILRGIMTVGLALHLCSMLNFLYYFKPLPSVVDKKTNKKAGLEGVGTGTDEPPVIVHEATPSEMAETEDPRIDVDDESVLGEPIPIAGPSTEMANRARTAVLQSNGAPGISSQFDPSVCTPAPEVEEEILRDLYRSFGQDPTAAAEGTSAGERSANRSFTVVRHGVASEDESGRNDDGGRPTRLIDTELEKATGWRRWLMLKFPFERYPFFVAMADIVITMGSGMTTQYFTMFMMVLYGVGPAKMAVLNLSNSTLISILAIVVGLIGRRYGRVRAIIPPKAIGAAILLWMALARGTTYAPTWLMCIAYVLRMSCMNSSAGLSRALIMDIVPEGKRGRWNAIESIQSAGWSGTALIGGFLADRWGYGAAFIITFVFHVAGICILLPLTVRNDTKLPIEVVEADDEAEAFASTVGKLDSLRVESGHRNDARAIRGHLPGLLWCRGPLRAESQIRVGSHQRSLLACNKYVSLRAKERLAFFWLEVLLVRMLSFRNYFFYLNFSFNVSATAVVRFIKYSRGRDPRPTQTTKESEDQCAAMDSDGDAAANMLCCGSPPPPWADGCIVPQVVPLITSQLAFTLRGFRRRTDDGPSKATRRSQDRTDSRAPHSPWERMTSTHTRHLIPLLVLILGLLLSSHSSAAEEKLQAPRTTLHVGYLHSRSRDQVLVAAQLDLGEAVWSRGSSPRSALLPSALQLLRQTGAADQITFSACGGQWPHRGPSGLRAAASLDPSSFPASSWSALTHRLASSPVCNRHILSVCGRAVSFDAAAARRWWAALLQRPAPASAPLLSRSTGVSLSTGSDDREGARWCDYDETRAGQLCTATLAHLLGSDAPEEEIEVLHDEQEGTEDLFAVLRALLGPWPDMPRSTYQHLYLHSSPAGQLTVRLAFVLGANEAEVRRVARRWQQRWPDDPAEVEVVVGPHGAPSELLHAIPPRLAVTTTAPDAAAAPHAALDAAISAVSRGVPQQYEVRLHVSAGVGESGRGLVAYTAILFPLTILQPWLHAVEGEAGNGIKTEVVASHIDEARDVQLVVLRSALPHLRGPSRALLVSIPVEEVWHHPSELPPERYAPLPLTEPFALLLTTPRRDGAEEAEAEAEQHPAVLCRAGLRTAPSSAVAMDHSDVLLVLLRAALGCNIHVNNTDESAPPTSFAVAWVRGAAQELSTTPRPHVALRTHDQDVIMIAFVCFMAVYFLVLPMAVLRVLFHYYTDNLLASPLLPFNAHNGCIYTKIYIPSSTFCFPACHGGKEEVVASTSAVFVFAVSISYLCGALRGERSPLD
eukprot:gene7297-5139_t